MGRKGEIKELNIRQLLTDGSQYKIPLYQRNYDWGEKEAVQLIEDISDYAAKAKNGDKQNYYIGSLVVYERGRGEDAYYETIDGQQRLTTLTILLCAMKNMDKGNNFSWFSKVNLSYDHREKAVNTLSDLFSGEVSKDDGVDSMNDVYQLLQKNLPPVLSDKGISQKQFSDYLLDNVMILRIPVPRDTDLNHYFEIMNSRGEQLEKHEILKAILMNDISQKYYGLFSTIWEACSDMSSYVQMNFTPSVRDILFDNWQNLNNSEFEDLNNMFVHRDDDADKDSQEDDKRLHSLTDLMRDAHNNIHYELPSDGKEQMTERFGSIINFSNFLLQVLKIVYHNWHECVGKVDNNIMLDDKRLLDIFGEVLKHVDRGKFVMEFIQQLLRYRVLFDKYVIKRENTDSKISWSLKKLKRYDKYKVNYVLTFGESDDEDTKVGSQIRMLEAMFHVSAPTQSKYWLQAVLYYLDVHEDDIDQHLQDFRDYLFHLAQTYMLDRYLCDEHDKTDFYDIIYKNNAQPTHKVNEIVWNNLNRGCKVENFVFNYYDFLVWNEEPNKYRDFEFTYRTSVEHFYPQHPIEPFEPLTKDTGLDDFGNLCLISRGMNSKFSNSMPKAKYDNFGKIKGIELSIKLQQMFEVVINDGDWSTPQINWFTEKSFKLIKDSLPRE